MVASTAVGSQGEARAQTEPLPNVLIILTDDQRPDTLDVMPATKQLFATEGTRFERAYATSPLCCPSRASIFSGRYAHNHGATNNGRAARFDEASGVQRYLQEQGYRTALFGKYLLGRPVSANPPYFDDWATFRNSPTSYRNGRWNVGGTVETVPGYSTMYMGKRAVQFIAQQESLDVQPWMMILSTAAPHKPFTPQSRYVGAPVGRFRATPAVRERDLSDKPPLRKLGDTSRRKARLVRAKQLRTLMSVDDMVERVFTALEESGETNTLAVYLSDNGYMWGEHGLEEKRYPYPASVEIPLLMRWPGRVSPGTTDRRLVANIDVAPTILEAAMTEPDEEYPIDGRSLLGDHSRDRLLLELRSDLSVPTWASTITPGYQYTEYYNDAGSKRRFREYYNLRSDPWQLHNLFGDKKRSNNPPVSVLQRRLTQDRRCVGQSCP